MKTFKDLINNIESFVDIHTQINAFHYGKFEPGDGHSYPLLSIEPINSNIDGTITQLSFKVSIYDLLEHDFSNRLDITSNLMVLEQDFLAYFWDSLTDTSNSSIQEGVTDDFDIRTELNVTFNAEMYSCYTPTNPITPLICSSSVVVPERPEEPFLFPVTIEAEGGVAPYSINKVFEYITEDMEKSIVHYGGNTEATIIFTDNKTFEFDYIESIYANYPYLIFETYNETIIGERIKVEFDYELIDGASFDLRFSSGAWSPYHLTSKYILNGESGTLEWDFEVINTDSSWVIRKADYSIPANLKVSNLRISYLDRVGNTEFEGDTYETVETFGTQNYTITDSEGSECNTSVDIEVPIPDDSYQIAVTPNLNYGGTNAQVKFYQHSGYGDGMVYVNWGDGSPIESFNPSTAYKYPKHQYTNGINGLQPIDIYGDGVVYFYLYQYNKAFIKAEFFQKFDDITYRRMYMYRGAFLSAIDEIHDKNGGTLDYFHYYYNGSLYGNLEGLKKGYYLYQLSPYHFTYSVNYAPGLYGDIGTYLKGETVYSTPEVPYYKQLVTYGGKHTYQDRIDAPIKITGNLYVRGYTNSIDYWSLVDPNEVAQLIVDFNTWRVADTVAFTLQLANNASPNNADEPLFSEFNTAKAELIADGFVVAHS